MEGRHLQGKEEVGECHRRFRVEVAEVVDRPYRVEVAEVADLPYRVEVAVAVVHRQRQVMAAEEEVQVDPLQGEAVVEGFPSQEEVEEAVAAEEFLAFLEVVAEVVAAEDHLRGR